MYVHIELRLFQRENVNQKVLDVSRTGRPEKPGQWETDDWRKGRGWYRKMAVLPRRHVSAGLLYKGRKALQAES